MFRLEASENVCCLLEPAIIKEIQGVGIPDLRNCRDVRVLLQKQQCLCFISFGTVLHLTKNIIGLSIYIPLSGEQRRCTGSESPVHKSQGFPESFRSVLSSGSECQRACKKGQNGYRYKLFLHYQFYTNLTYKFNYFSTIFVR